jgi:hypothetical protein
MGSTHSRGGIEGGAQWLDSRLHGAWGGQPVVQIDCGGGSVSTEGRRKGRARVGRLEPKGRAKRAGSKEKEHGP